MNAYLRFDQVRYLIHPMYAFERRREKSSRTREFYERPAPSFVENYVASPSIMKRPLIMKATEGVPSGGITIFHAYCLTAERLQAVLTTAVPTNPLCPICPLPPVHLPGHFQLTSTLSLH